MGRSLAVTAKPTGCRTLPLRVWSTARRRWLGDFSTRLTRREPLGDYWPEIVVAPLAMPTSLRVLDAAMPAVKALACDP